MPKKSPTREERLAAALRENLKRRKAVRNETPAQPKSPAAAPPAERPNADMKAD